MTWLILGVLTSSLIEYVYHRHAGHLKKYGIRIYKTHTEHHADPQEGGVLLFTKYRQRWKDALKLNGVLTLFALPASLIFNHTLTSWLIFLAGADFGYLYLEWFHHRMHHKVPRNRVERYLWRHHYTHHFQNSRVNFGFTTPLWDFMFATYRPAPKSIAVPRKQAPPGLENDDAFIVG